jgi:hypothetical protein
MVHIALLKSLLIRSALIPTQGGREYPLEVGVAHLRALGREEHRRQGQALAG